MGINMETLLQQILQKSVMLKNIFFFKYCNIFVFTKIKIVVNKYSEILFLNIFFFNKLNEF